MPVAYQAPHAQRRIDLRSLLDVGNAAAGPSQSPTKKATIDLDWEPFNHDVNVFLRSLDSYALGARQEIAKRANQHAAEVRTLNANKEETDRRINIEREREAQMLAAVDAERQVLTNLQSSLSHLQSTLAKVKEQSASIEQELNQVKRETNAEEAEKARQKAMLEEQKERDKSELQVLEEGLGIKIEGVDNNVILIRFTLLDPAEPDREFSLVINLSQTDYTVPQCEPMIPTLPELISQLNTDRQFYSFIKRVRKAFRALVPEPPKAASRFDDMAGPGLRTPGSRRVLENGLQDMRLDA